MSRTDKDRPTWVINHDLGRIEHDHRHGTCVPETLADGPNGPRRWRHWAVCAKRTETEFYCTKTDPYIEERRDRQPCWRSWLEPTRGTRRDPETGRRVEVLTGFRWRSTQCEGHVRLTWDERVPCSCDDWAPSPTCTIEHVVYRDHAGSAPAAVCATYYHRPERRRARDELRDAVRRYNGGDDLENDLDGFDFISRQARHSVAWDWN